MKNLLPLLLILTLCVPMTYASWRSPVLLSELNDAQRGIAANRPTISNDGRVIYFTRSMPEKPNALWEARRDANGVFSEQRQLAELKNGGANVTGAWLSADKLHLYYSAPDPTLAAPARPIWLAIRNTPVGEWRLLKRLELVTAAFTDSCTLTGDELNIMWAAAPQAEGVYPRIFIASRPSTLHNFANIRAVNELNELQARMPSLSANGLTVYFVREAAGTPPQAWVGHRKSLQEPFGNFRQIESINRLGPVGKLSPAWNGRELYYFQRQGQPQDVKGMGIFVSHWVDDSFADVIDNLRRATELKQNAVGSLRDASRQEKIAYNLLTTLPADAFPAYLTPIKITDAAKRIESSVIKQDQAIGVLNICLLQLKLSLNLLLPPIPPVQ